MLVDDDATNGGHGDVATHAADRRGVTPTTLHLLLKSEQKQEKREQHKQMNNAMHITGGHQQKRLKAGLLGQRLRTPGAQ
jgi:hypothetical protein